MSGTHANPHKRYTPRWLRFEQQHGRSAAAMLTSPDGDCVECGEPGSFNDSECASCGAEWPFLESRSAGDGYAR